MVDGFVAGFGRRWGEAYAVSGYLTVAREGQVIFARAYGNADREKQLAAGADTRFRIGSLTKQLTATAILQLVERGKLRLDASIRAYLPYYPRAGDGITIHHLLTHTSGIPDYEVDEALNKDRARAHTRAEVFASFQNLPLDFKPGERFSYSSSGYLVLGAIIEKVSGATYEGYLRENVLLPAGMLRTTTVDAPDSAVGYLADRNERLVPSPPIDHHRSRCPVSEAFRPAGGAAVSREQRIVLHQARRPRPRARPGLLGQERGGRRLHLESRRLHRPLRAERAIGIVGAPRR